MQYFMKNSRSEMAERLVAQAHRWASARKARTIVILSSISEEATDEVEVLTAAWENLGLRVVIATDWEDMRVTAASCFLPLLTWAYEDAPDEFSAALRRLQHAGAQPRADLIGISWILRKSLYLADLSLNGVPVVPTVPIEAGATAETLRAAFERAGELSPCNGQFVVKPDVGGGGSGVERLATDDQSAVDETLRVLERRALLVQPFLSLVSTEGELSFVFVNGQLLHAVRKEPCGWGRPLGIDALPSTAEEETAHAAEVDASRHSPFAQPSTRLDPPPSHAEVIAWQALHVARRCCAVEDPPGFFLARVDLLPSPSLDDRFSGSNRTSSSNGSNRGESVRWLVSEIEIGWPHLFLRAAGANTHEAAERVAEALVHHSSELRASARFGKGREERDDDSVDTSRAALGMPAKRRKAQSAET